jgi:rabankyrin-5
MALASGQYGIAASLVEHQVNLNQMDGGGHSLLHLAILRRDRAAALFLLRHGAQLNLQTRDEARDSALHLMARADDADAAALLTEVAEAMLGSSGNGSAPASSSAADINLQNAAGETPLMVAIQHENMTMFELLLAHGPNLELTSLAGKPALWFALQQEQQKVVGDSSEQQEFPAATKLVAAGADVNAICSPTGDTLLHSLARQGNSEAATLFLLSSGAAVNRLNRRGESVLHLAAQQGLATLATALLVAGADPNLQTGCSAAAAAASPPGGEGEGVWRQTALHLALLHQQEAVVSCLLEFSRPTADDGFAAVVPLDINLKNSADETPLGLALGRAGLRHMAAAMLAAGADVDVRDASGLTLLQKAIGEANTAAALFLLQHGADINLRTPQGLTPLELAVRNRAGEVIRAQLS